MDRGTLLTGSGLNSSASRLNVSYTAKNQTTTTPNFYINGTNYIIANGSLKWPLLTYNTSCTFTAYRLVDGSWVQAAYFEKSNITGSGSITFGFNNGYIGYYYFKGHSTANSIEVNFTIYPCKPATTGNELVMYSTTTSGEKDRGTLLSEFYFNESTYYVSTRN